MGTLNRDSLERTQPGSRSLAVGHSHAVNQETSHSETSHSVGAQQEFPTKYHADPESR